MQACGPLSANRLHLSKDKYEAWARFAEDNGIVGPELFCQFDPETWELLFSSLLRFPASAMTALKSQLGAVTATGVVTEEILLREE